MSGAGRTVRRGPAAAVTGTRRAGSRRGVLAELFERVPAPFADGPAADRGRVLGGAAGAATLSLGFPAARDAGRLVVAVPGDLVLGFPPAGTDDGPGTWQTLAYAAGPGRPRLAAPLG